MRDLTYRLSSPAAQAYDVVVDVGIGAVDAIEGLHTDKLEEWPSFVRELFGRVYRPVDEKRGRLPEPEACEWAAVAHRTLESQGDWPALIAATQGHRAIAAQAAATLACAVTHDAGIDKMKADPVKASDPALLRRRSAALDEQAPDGVVVTIPVVRIREAAASLRMGATMGESMRKALAKRAALMPDIGQVVTEAMEAAAHAARCVRAARGWGMYDGEQVGPDADIDDEILKMLMSDERLLRILETIGRMQERAAAIGAAKVSDGCESLVGITTGDNPARLVPSEAVRLGHPVLAGELFARMLDKGAMVWKMRGTKHMDRGPMRILVDRSGSMADERIVFARAVAGAAMLTAHAQKRHVWIALFDDSVEGVDVEPGSRLGLLAAMRLLAGGVRGGTNADGALLAATSRRLQTKGHADILMITDGTFPLPGERSYGDSVLAGAAVKAWRAAGGRTHLVGIDESMAKHKPWTDEIHEVNARGDTDGAGAEILTSLFAKVSVQK